MRKFSKKLIVRAMEARQREVEHMLRSQGYL